MSSKTVTIIGGGLSGTLTAIQLLLKAKSPMTIYLLEQVEKQCFRGVAYSSQLAYQPLNVPAKAMSLFPDKPLDFVDWLQQHQQRYTPQLSIPVSENDFIPRYIFGDYLHARLQEGRQSAAKGIEFSILQAEAIAVEREITTQEKLLVTLADGRSIESDHVVLALGNFAPSDVPIPNMPFYQSKAYAALPWSEEALADLPKEAPVLLIGSSLTMIDLVGTLDKMGHRGKVYVLSRHGMLPQVFDTQTRPYQLPALPLHPHLSILDLFRFVRQEIREAEVLGYSWRSVLDGLREHIPAIWQALPLSEKKRFLRHLRPYWETHRHRMPPRSAELLQQLQDKGQLKIIAADLVDAATTATGAKVYFRPRGTRQVEALEVARVINCTGPTSDFRKVSHPLVQQLLQDELITPDPLYLGLMTAANGTLLRKSGQPISNLYTLGPPRKSMLYESTALREIRQQAKNLAQELVQESFSSQRAVQVA
ncbi:FAD/NAD(P)-binding protein [Pontibacter ruber]|uniref:FAD/NAD(P)-binding protein n=1 Tax=Pontibacter ruber TaxID=1343895 RepID=A0ABW5CSY9_9BACT|nr:FAD/NAD(P)-binding protein [Pontibacter ruber]